MNTVWAAAMGACGLLAACSGPGGIGLGGRAEGSVTMTQPCGTLYTAALMAVPDAGYRVASADRAGGLILGSQDTVLGGGSSVGLTVLLEPLGGACRVTATVKAPPAGLSLTPLDGNVRSYIDAVQARTGPTHRVAGGRY